MIHTLVKIQFIVLYIPYCSNYQRGRDNFIDNGRKRKFFVCLREKLSVGLCDSTYLVKVHNHITDSTTAT